MARERRRLSPLAWEVASSLLQDRPCCINSFGARDYGEPLDERLFLREAKASDLAWHDSRYCRSLCFHIDPRDGQNQNFLLLDESLIYGLSYPKKYSTNLRVIAPLANILLYHKNVLMIVQTLVLMATYV